MISFVFLILNRVLYTEKLKIKTNPAEGAFPIPFYENYTILENIDLQKRTIGKIRSEYKRSFNTPLSGCKKPKECKPKLQDKCQKILPSLEDHINSLKILNFIRYLAGLQKNIIEDEQWSEQCYKSAINIQKIGKIPFDHLIKREDAIEQYCGDESNIQFTNNSRLLITENSMNVFKSLSKFIASEEVTDLISLLHPNMLKVGFGFYPFRKEKINGLDSIKPSITVIKVSDKPLFIQSADGKKGIPPNLDFLSWPPDGPFPIEFLRPNWFVRHPDFGGLAGTNEIEAAAHVEGEEGGLRIERASVLADVLVLKISEGELFKCKEGRTVVVTVVNHHTRKVYRLSFKLFEADKRKYFGLTENGQKEGHLNSEKLNGKSAETNHTFLNVLAVSVSSVSVLSIIVFMGVGEASEKEDIEAKEDEKNRNKAANGNVPPVDNTTATCCYCGTGCAYIGCACCGHNWGNCECKCDDCDCDCNDCGSLCDLCAIFG